MSHYDEFREKQAEDLKDIPGTQEVNIPVLLIDIMTEMNILKREIKDIRKNMEKLIEDKQ